MNPFKSQQMAAPRNMLSGYAEPAHVNDFMFEQQRRTFSSYGKPSDLGLDDAVYWCYLNFNDFTILPSLLKGYALDPSVDTHESSSNTYIGAVEEAEKHKGKYYLYSICLSVKIYWYVQKAFQLFSLGEVCDSITIWLLLQVWLCLRAVWRSHRRGKRSKVEMQEKLTITLDHGQNMQMRKMWPNQQR